MKDYSLIHQHLKSYIEISANLKSVGILRNKKDFTSQVGEWLVSELYDGTFAESSTQKDWDIKVGNDFFIQVKAHAKAIDNPNRWTEIKYGSDAKISELIIIVFTHDYKLKEFYKLPWKIAQTKISEDKTRRLIRWNHISEFKVEFKSLPKQNLVKLFL